MTVRVAECKPEKIAEGSRILAEMISGNAASLPYG